MTNQQPLTAYLATLLEDDVSAILSLAAQLISEDSELTAGGAASLATSRRVQQRDPDPDPYRLLDLQVVEHHLLPGEWPRAQVHRGPGGRLEVSCDAPRARLKKLAAMVVVEGRSLLSACQEASCGVQTLLAVCVDLAAERELREGFSPTPLAARYDHLHQRDGLTLNELGGWVNRDPSSVARDLGRKNDTTSTTDGTRYVDRAPARIPQDRFSELAAAMHVDPHELGFFHTLADSRSPRRPRAPRTARVAAPPREAGLRGVAAPDGSPRSEAA